MIRAWLRRLIGWEEVGAALIAERNHIVNLQSLVEAQSREIAALTYMRHQREAKAQSLTDWEQVQIQHALNPDNFTEKKGMN